MENVQFISAYAIVDYDFYQKANKEYFNDFSKPQEEIVNLYF